LDHLAVELEDDLGTEVQAREVQEIGGLKAVGLVATGNGKSGTARFKQHWVTDLRQNAHVGRIPGLPEIDSGGPFVEEEAILAGWRIQAEISWNILNPGMDRSPSIAT
jgi:hypothetical protein